MIVPFLVLKIQYSKSELQFSTKRNSVLTLVLEIHLT
jgi:hypothetical protein